MTDAWRPCALAVVVALSLAACTVTRQGSAGDVPSTPATTSTTTFAPAPIVAPESTSRSPNPVAVEVTLEHYAIEPPAGVMPAGVVTVNATNRDGAPHNVVLLNTALSPAQLPTTGIRVDETSSALEVLARTPTIAGRGSGTLTATLEPGTYLLVCTVPHHYVREAMVATLTVRAGSVALSPGGMR